MQSHKVVSETNEELRIDGNLIVNTHNLTDLNGSTDDLVSIEIELNAEDKQNMSGKESEEVSAETVEKKEKFEIYKAKLRDGLKDFLDNSFGREVEVEKRDDEENINIDEIPEKSTKNGNSTLSQNQIILFKSYVHHCHREDISNLEKVEEGSNDVLSSNKSIEKLKRLGEKRNAIDVYRCRHEELQGIDDGKMRNEGERSTKTDHEENVNDATIDIRDKSVFDFDFDNYNDMVDEEWMLERHAIYQIMSIRIRLSNDIRNEENVSEAGSKNENEKRSDKGSEEGSEKGSEEGSEKGSDEGSEKGSEEGSEEGSEKGIEEGSEEGSEDESDSDDEMGFFDDTSDDESLNWDSEEQDDEKNVDGSEDRIKGRSKDRSKNRSKDRSKNKSKAVRVLFEEYSGIEKLEAEFENEVVKEGSADDDEIDVVDVDNADNENEKNEKDDDKNENEKNDAGDKNDVENDDNSEQYIQKEPSSSIDTKSKIVTEGIEKDITDFQGKVGNELETGHSETVNMSPMTKKKKKTNNLAVWKSKLAEKKKLGIAHEEEEEGKEDSIDREGSSSSSSSSSSGFKKGKLDKTMKSVADRVGMRRKSSPDQLDVKRVRRSVSPFTFTSFTTSSSSSSPSAVTSVSNKNQSPKIENKKKSGRVVKEEEEEELLEEKIDKRKEKRGRRSSGESSIENDLIDDEIENTKLSKKIKSDDVGKELKLKKLKIKVEKEEKIVWTKKHSSIGTKVANFFETGKGKKVILKEYYGTVSKYAYESKAGAKDELFHIIWDDGDEEDYDLKDLKSGEKKYKMLLKENR